jgi:hypothetical protein
MTDSKPANGLDERIGSSPEVDSSTGNAGRVHWLPLPITLSLTKSMSLTVSIEIRPRARNRSCAHERHGISTEIKAAGAEMRRRSSMSNLAAGKTMGFLQ